MTKRNINNVNDINFNLEKIEVLFPSSSLNSFVKRNENTKTINYKIYHLLYRPFTFINAYSKISKNKGALSKGIKEDENFMQFFSIQRATTIAKLFKDDKYKWQPTRRTLIPKPKTKKMRPIDTPTQKDRIVQEALRGMLEAIYEPEFREFEYNNSFQCTNYGFRPGKSCWQAVRTLQSRGQSSNYVIEGDITGAYNNVNHEILISILERRIKDKRFIKLIKNLLTAGIMDQNNYIHNLKGTPQGGILSPILFNIYMFEFDKFIYTEIIQPVNELNKNRRKKQKNPIYQKLLRENKILRNKLREFVKSKNILETNRTKKLIKIKTKQLFKTNSYTIDTIPKNYVYTRYADDWVLFINETKENTNFLKETISKFISKTLQLTLDSKKTKITQLTQGISFLGFNVRMNSNSKIKIARITTIIKDTKTRMIRRTTSRKITIIPDSERLLLKLQQNKFCNNIFYPIGKRSWTVYDPYEIVLKYRQILIGIHNYYSECDNIYILYRVSYILQYSCAKTLATRLKITTSQIFNKYGKELKVEKIFFKNSKEQRKYITLPSLAILRNKNNPDVIKTKSFKDLDPFHLKEFWRTKLKFYLNCCICDSSDNIGMHHINSLRSIKPGKRDKFEYIRSQTQRIQIPVCQKCHNDITFGRYNKEKPIKFYNEKVAKL